MYPLQSMHRCDLIRHSNSENLGKSRVLLTEVDPLATACSDALPLHRHFQTFHLSLELLQKVNQENQRKMASTNLTEDVVVL